jgi:hypothetical protein
MCVLSVWRDSPKIFDALGGVEGLQTRNRRRAIRLFDLPKLNWDEAVEDPPGSSILVMQEGYFISL